MSFFCLGLSVHNSPLSLSSALLADLCGSLEFPARGFCPFSAGNCPPGSFPGAPNPASSHTVGARLPPPFALDRFFRWDSGVNAGIIEIRIVIPPTVVILFRDLPGLQFGGLLLPGTKPLLKISGFGAAIKNFGTKADQTIGVQNADQFPIFQCEKRVHQAIHAVNIRHSNRLRRHIQSIRHLCGQISFRRAVLGFILRQPDISRIIGKAQHKSQILLRHPP